MTTPKDKLKPWESPLPALPESEEELLPTFRCGNPQLMDRMRYEPQMLEPLPPSNWLPPIDWLALLGVGSGVVAFLLWAWPECWLSARCERFTEHWFSSAERLPAVAAFLALSFILLLLRRR